MAVLREEQGSAAAEFVLVASMMTTLVLAVLQLAYGIFVANVCRDAALEGAHYAALADVNDREGGDRARALISRAVGQQFAGDVSVTRSSTGSDAWVRVTVRTAIPLLGPIGIPGTLTVTAHAPSEVLP